MILVVDSGSTKTDWISVNQNGDELFSTQTLGLNPQVLSSAILKERIINNFDLYQNRKKVTHLYFYGAGCGVESPQLRIRKVFKEIFTKSKITIKEDTYAAVYAASKPREKCIVCILGTGSNCTYFDGKEIEQRVDSLGYVLMDEASGNYYGKQLIRSYYFNTMPKELAVKFAKEYNWVLTLRFFLKVFHPEWILFLHIWEQCRFYLQKFQPRHLRATIADFYRPDLCLA